MSEPKILIEVKKFLEHNNIEYIIKTNSDNYHEIFKLEDQENSILVIKSNGSISIPKNNQSELETKLLDFASTNVTKQINTDLERIKNFRRKYSSKIRPEIQIKYDEYSIIYSNSIKKLFAYPMVKIIRIASLYYINPDKRQAHKENYIVDLINNDFYSMVSHIIDKPLNKYSDEELTVLEMQLI